MAISVTCEPLGSRHVSSKTLHLQHILRHFRGGSRMASGDARRVQLKMCQDSRHGFWTPNDTKHLFAGATDHNPMPINGLLDDLKFGRNRVYHKVGMSRRRIIVLRNGCLSDSATFWTGQGNSDLVGHLYSMGSRPVLTLSEFCSPCPIFVL